MLPHMKSTSLKKTDNEIISAMFRLGLSRRDVFVVGVLCCFSASFWWNPAPVSGCKKEVVVDPNAECTENAIAPKSEIRNGTYGEKEACNNCYCIKGTWKCEIKKCG